MNQQGWLYDEITVDILSVTTTQITANVYITETDITTDEFLGLVEDDLSAAVINVAGEDDNGDDFVTSVDTVTTDTTLGTVGGSGNNNNSDNDSIFSQVKIYEWFIIGGIIVVSFFVGCLAYDYCCVQKGFSGKQVTLRLQSAMSASYEPGSIITTPTSDGANTNTTDFYQTETELATTEPQQVNININVNQGLPKQPTVDSNKIQNTAGAPGDFDGDFVQQEQQPQETGVVEDANAVDDDHDIEDMYGEATGTNGEPGLPAHVEPGATDTKGEENQ